MRRSTWFVIAAFAVVLFATTDAHALTPLDADRNARPVTLATALRKGRSSVAYRKWIIQQVWGRDARIGLRIAYCESGYRVAARDYADGSHRGIFQMGTRERATYGHGSGAWDQAGGAYAYFRLSGTGPWAASRHCWKPSG